MQLLCTLQGATFETVKGSNVLHHQVAAEHSVFNDVMSLIGHLTL